MISPLSGGGRDAVPMISKAQVQALAAGDAWLEKGSNLLCFGPPGGGKSHLCGRTSRLIIRAEDHERPIPALIGGSLSWPRPLTCRATDLLRRDTRNCFGRQERAGVSRGTRHFSRRF